MITIHWSGSPGSSGVSWYRITQRPEATELWLHIDGVHEQEDHEWGELLRESSDVPWRAATRLLVEEPESPIDTLSIRGATGIVRELLVLAIGNDEWKRVASVLSTLEEESLIQLRSRSGPLDSRELVRELHALDEDLLAIGVEDGLATLLRGCPAQELSIEALEATAQALIDEAGRQREVEEAARLERQAREDALLAPYSEEIGRMVAEWFRHNGSSGSWASRAAEARKRAVERAIRTHLLERGTFPAGTTEVEYEFFGPRRFLVDFDRLRGAP